MLGFQPARSRSGRVTSSWAPEGQDHSTQIGPSLQRDTPGRPALPPARGPPEGAPAAGVHIPYPRCFLQPCGGLEGATGPGSTRVPSCISAGPGSRPRTGTCRLIRLSSVCLFVVQVPFSLAFCSLCQLLGPLPPGGSASSDPSPSCQPGSSGVGWLASPGQSWEALLRPDG